jgi:hypothetical protein
MLLQLYPSISHQYRHSIQCRAKKVRTDEEGPLGTFVLEQIADVSPVKED